MVMRLLVTLSEASVHLRRDTTDDDTDLEMKVAAASEAVIAYLGDGATFLDSNGAVIEDSNGDPVVPAQVHAATLLMVGYLYKDRDENADNAYEQGYLPKPVTAILYPLKQFGIA